MIMMLIGLGILFSLIFGWKGISAIMIKRYLESMQQTKVTVSATKIGYSSWQPKLKSVASLRALMGINVTTELAGMVKTIHFTPGQEIKKGELLVQLNAGTELGQL